ncbi:MAG: Lrp/AsnC ligand binding domain-containing protein [Thaumarchaeota archaeon]|nr:Lrp/AsnC ligand binding domain-containing protein [Nitrososphaerota archaeon]MBI3023701.1 Lrp/AsnC ligand binding domain-containing protein [Nitrososphaerota archaeon]
MTIGFVLINVNLGSEEGVLARLRGMENVKEAHQVYGVYDIVAKLEAESTEKLKGVLEEKVRKLENVRSTLTVIAVE